MQTQGICGVSWGAGLYAGVYGVLVMHRSIPAAPSPPPPSYT